MDETMQENSSSVSKLKLIVKQEVQVYLAAIEDCGDVDPLIWWNENKCKYPNVAKVARKWLAAPAPSERVFLICGLVDTARRSRINGESLEKQVFFHNNYSKFK